jgi:hypothetical protein
MSDKLSISGDDDDWKIFGKAAQSGNPLLFRSRTRSPAVQAYATENQMARVRCVIAPAELAGNGMPKSTRDLDDFEDSLLGALQAENAEVYLIAAVTGDGNRDLFFAARDLDDLRAGIKAAENAPTISLQFAPVGDAPAFLKMLTLSKEQERAAFEAGRVHEVPVKSGGGLLGKLLGR